MTQEKMITFFRIPEHETLPTCTVTFPTIPSGEDLLRTRERSKRVQSLKKETPLSSPAVLGKLKVKRPLTIV